MKKGIKYLLTLGFIALAPLSAKATEAKVNFNCPDTALPGGEISCKISVGSTDVVMGGIEAKYTLGTEISYVSFVPSYTYPININSSKGIVITDTAGFQKTEIGTVTFKLPQDTTSNSMHTITLRNIVLSDRDSIPYHVDSITESIRIKSSNNDLSALSVTGATLDFNKQTKTYNLAIDADKTTISAIKEDSKATITGLGEKSLKYGLNKIEVKVTSETGVTNVYTLNITRPDNRSTTKDLLSFGIHNYSLNFKKDTKTYSLTVENAISEIYESKDGVQSDKYLYIDYDKLEHDGVDYTFKLNGVKVGKLSASSSQDSIKLGELKVGENKLEVIVVAENESTQTYTFNITRKEEEKEVVTPEDPSDKEEPGDNTGSGDKEEPEDNNEPSDKEETPEENPGTGLFVGVGIVVFIISLSICLYFLISRKNKFPQVN